MEGRGLDDTLDSIVGAAAAQPKDWQDMEFRSSDVLSVGDTDTTIVEKVESALEKMREELREELRHCGEQTVRESVQRIADALEKPSATVPVEVPTAPIEAVLREHLASTTPSQQQREEELQRLRSALDAVIKTRRPEPPATSGWRIALTVLALLVALLVALRVLGMSARPAAAAGSSFRQRPPVFLS
ncbi:MAG: hypothetical protein MHM6MM_006477 [Cercozoa sp. M6MM]